MSDRIMDAIDTATPVEVFLPASREPGAVLLETERPTFRDRHSFLLRTPLVVLSTVHHEEVAPLLEEAAAWQARGFPVAGFLSYEAGFALEPAAGGWRGALPAGGDAPCSFDENTSVPRDGVFPRSAGSDGFPLAWFGVYGGYLRFDHLRGRWSMGGSSPPEWTAPGDETGLPSRGGPLEPRFSFAEEEYAGKVEAIRRAIRNGEVYQANLTGKFRFPVGDDPFALYLRLRAAQPVRYGAFLRTEAGCIVSRSPELFFRVRGGRIETRPMKGTAPRGLTASEDRRAAARLRSDPKNRAENVMIVDLLRNDLGRVCRVGSVRVPRLFAVERHRTLLQMDSTVTGTLRPGTTLLSLCRALFPCGSVTGAPKIASMRLLRRVEDSPRGVYTGAIGILLPGGDMTFSVAIRTVAVKNGQAEAGSGGGIVWDSEPAEEYREALLKGRYLADPPPEFRLIETLRWSPRGGFRLLADHLRRLASSAKYFGFRFRRESVLSALEGAVRAATGRDPLKIRLLLAEDGSLSGEAWPLPPPRGRDGIFRVRLSAVTVSSRDPFVRHKTTNRGWRDEERRRAIEEGFDEVLFLNERGELTDGAITNLFLEIGGRLLTPPPSCGLLDGVFRRHVLADRSRRAAERILYPEDLEKADRILLTNAVSGVIGATTALG